MSAEREPPERLNARDVLAYATQHDAVLKPHQITMAAAICAQWEYRGIDRRAELDRAAQAAALKIRGPTAVERFTTDELYQGERETMARLQLMASRPTHGLKDDAVARAIEKVERENSLKLSDDQKNAIRHACAPGQARAIIGDAGTGKSTAMAAVAAAYRAAGYQVIGTAPTGRAASELRDSIDGPTATIHSLLGQHEAARIINEKTAIIADEMGMADSRTFQGLVRAADAAGAKLILVGDPKQLPPVGPGALFKHVSNPALHGIPTERLNVVFRQRDPEQRAAMEKFAHGNVAAALKWYQQNDKLHIFENYKDAAAAMAARHQEFAAKHGYDKTITIAPRNETCADINRLIHGDRLARGELGEVRTYEQLHVRRIATARGEEVHERFLKVEYAVGDRVVYVGANDRSRDLMRSDLGTVKEVRPDGLLVAFDGKGEKFINPREDELRLGYAVTTYRSQGSSPEAALIYATPEEMTYEKSYVAMTRPRSDDTGVFTTRMDIDKAVEELGVPLPDDAAQTPEQQINDLISALETREDKESTLDYTLATDAPDAPDYRELKNNDDAREAYQSALDETVAREIAEAREALDAEREPPEFIKEPAPADEKELAAMEKEAEAAERQAEAFDRAADELRSEPPRPDELMPGVAPADVSAEDVARWNEGCQSAALDAREQAERDADLAREAEAQARELEAQHGQEAEPGRESEREPAPESGHAPEPDAAAELAAEASHETDEPEREPGAEPQDLRDSENPYDWDESKSEPEYNPDYDHGR